MLPITPKINIVDPVDKENSQYYNTSFHIYAQQKIIDIYINMSNSWNKYHENLLKKWAEMAKTYTIMHSLCAQYYATWHKRLGIPVIILGGATSSSVFSSNKEDSEVWTYVNGGLVLLVTALVGVSGFIGTVEKTTKHQTASFKYTKISMDIDTLLSFGRRERTSTPQEFIYSKKAEMLEIRENAPEVLAWILADYLKRFDKSLTNTKSKVNKKRCIEPSYSNSYRSDSLQNQPVGEVLADFGDKMSEKMALASEAMQDLHTDSDISGSDSEPDLEVGDNKNLSNI